uniref:LAGLIDADG homing endonuclease n=1 Tax=Porodaedalea pini TaxID=108901 RepID=A0A5B9RB06_9AGAM|nr:LAGLIDADG homing endonuclease [Porodaedalea pini]QEG57014.1 LAGLIDADG homing endonuclease [Porodaedalea pini]
MDTIIKTKINIMKNIINIKNVRNVNFLPENLHFVLIGIMLGDGGIYRSSSTSNSRFEMSFGTKYKQFAESIGYLFKDYMNSPVKAIELKGKDKNYINFRLKTSTLPLFNKDHEMFYKFNTEKGKFVKIVPPAPSMVGFGVGENILDNLNPVVLAYLIMTDGNFDKNRNRIRIYTNSETTEDVNRLAVAINSNLGIYAGVLHDRKDQWILTIGAKQLSLLRDIVSPHFESSMFYRIGL